MTLQPIQVPSIQIPVIDPHTGLMNPAWQRMFVALTQPPAAIQEVAPTGSPFTYTASVAGHLLVQGGTVSKIVLTRARVIIDPTGLTSGFVPLSQKDQAEITYTVLPNVWFIPS